MRLVLIHTELLLESPEFLDERGWILVFSVLRDAASVHSSKKRDLKGGRKKATLQLLMQYSGSL